MLTLEDLKGFSEERVLQHLSEEYAASDEDRAKLIGKKVHIAYECVGSWGCDSASFFLLEDEQGNLFEIHGSHNSCYGFRGQLDLEATSVKALQYRAKNRDLFQTGGYMEDVEANKNAASTYVLHMGL